MRVLKMLAHLAIQFIILVALIESKDEESKKLCDNRMNCYNSCNSAYFPSLFCQNI